MSINEDKGSLFRIDGHIGVFININIDCRVIVYIVIECLSEGIVQVPERVLLRAQFDVLRRVAVHEVRGVAAVSEVSVSKVRSRKLGWQKGVRTLPVTAPCIEVSELGWIRALKHGNSQSAD